MPDDDRKDRNVAINERKNHCVVISKQLLKSATSIGANVEEATAAQSKRDFISKMSIASKEARETKYWLRLLEDSEITKIEVYLTYDWKGE